MFRIQILSAGAVQGVRSVEATAVPAPGYMVEAWCLGDRACGADLVLGAMLSCAYHAPILCCFASLPHIPVSLAVCAVVGHSPAVIFLHAVCEAEDVCASLHHLFGFLFVPRRSSGGRCVGCCFRRGSCRCWGCRWCLWFLVGRGWHVEVVRTEVRGGCCGPG